MGRCSARSKKKNRLPPFVAITWEMLNSEAYKALPYSAAKALPYFLGKVKTVYSDPQKYLTSFHFSYTEAGKYGFALATHHKVICKLIEKGFIDPVDKGGLRSGGLGYSFFRLSLRWGKYGTPEFKKAEKWESFLPQFRQKSTPILETHSFINGNRND